MKRLLSFYVALLATTCLWAQNNVITYTANAQLTKTFTYASFNANIISHTFSGGVGNIIFDSDVTVIGSYAFQRCSSLTSITIPNSVTEIGEYAFSYCSGLTSITIPNSVTSIGREVFSYCSGLTSVIIGNNVTTIDVRTFTGCTSLTSITIPSSVNYIGDSAFEGCYQNISVYYTGTISDWVNIYYRSTGRLSSYDLYIDNQKVENLVIPNEITNIRDYAFAGCTSLTSVTIPNTNINFGSSVFAGCTNLKSVTIEKNKSVISYELSIPNNVVIYVPSSLLSLYQQNSGWNKYTIFAIGTQTEFLVTSTASSYSSSVATQISSNLLQVVKLTITGTINSYDIEQLRNMTNLRELDLSGASIVNSTHRYYNSYSTEDNKIGPWMFYGLNRLENILLPSNVVSIGDYAFYNLGLISITIPNSVMSIGNYAFYVCSRLKSITISNGVTSIGDYAFYGCSGLTSITCEAVNPPSITSGSLNNVPKNIPVYVPCGATSAYHSANYWSEFTNIQEMECEPEEYTRDVTPGNYGTICLPKAVAQEALEDCGGVFFKIVYAVTNTNDEVTGILMEEETEGLEAGEPYIFRATADELVLPYTGEAVADPVAANGLVGNLSETPLNVPQDMYVLSNNQIRKLAGGTATAGQNRAYIDLTNVTKLNYVPAAAPNRVVLNVEGSNPMATDLENIKSEEIQKVIRDGQVLILRDGKTYNVLGNTL